jgi:hypothetical protein
MKRMRRWFAVGLVVVAAAAAFGPINSAVAFFSGGLSIDVHVNSPATLVARGAALKVPVTIDCNSTRGAYLEVDATERTGSGIAQGYTEEHVACIGGPQQLTVQLTAYGHAFKRGTAVVTATLGACGFGTCGNESDTQSISVVRK